jgi:DNA phosphorothioation-associated putative methyltransferase
MSDEIVSIRREKTAIFRDRLSTPMQILLKHQFLDGEHTVFDYGCGRGDDLRTLEGQGIEARGWDPFYAPQNRKVSADVVNLGFVINVIENANERSDALKAAFALAEKLLVVAVMLDSQAQYKSVASHGDGIVTSSRTFQKYYSQAEIRKYVEHQLARQPIVVGPGCLFIFKADQDEQDFLSRRHSHRIPPDELVKWSLPSDKNLRTYERNKDLLEDFWRCCLALGRIPANDEYKHFDELRERVGSPKKAIAILSGDERSAALKDAAKQRENDLSVFFALNLFERRRSIAALSASLQRDVKSFYGTYKAALEFARPLLFSAGNPNEILSDCKCAADSGTGHMEGDKSFTVSVGQINKLPPLLRIYIGCASQLYGDVDSAHLVKIHIGSAKLTLTRYDDFDGKAVPLMLERIKINMRSSTVDYFEYGGEFPPHPLYLKSRFLNRRSKAYRQQKAFDDAFEHAIPLRDFSEHGPSVLELQRLLKKCALQIKGFALTAQSN